MTINGEIVIVGMDPGVQPTLAMLRGSTVEFCEATCVQVKIGKNIRRDPEPHLIANQLKWWRPDLVIIEKVNPRPKEGVTSVGGFMKARGMLEGVCAGLGIPFILIDPVTWTRQMKVKKGDDAGRARALELMPELANDLARKKDHNRADAILLALWGRQFVIPSHPLFS